MISPFSRLRAATTRHIKMNIDQLARWRATTGAARNESDYLRGSGAGVRPICLNSAISLATVHCRKKAHQAYAGILVADATIQWKIDVDGEKERPTCN